MLLQAHVHDNAGRTETGCYDGDICDAWRFPQVGEDALRVLDAHTVRVGILSRPYPSDAPVDRTPSMIR